MSGSRNWFSFVEAYVSWMRLYRYGPHALTRPQRMRCIRIKQLLSE